MVRSMGFLTLTASVLCISIVCGQLLADPLNGKAPSETKAKPSPTGDSGSKAEGEASLQAAVLRVNSKLKRDYSLLDPKPLTVAKVRQAIESALPKLAESDAADRYALVEALQQILLIGHLPEDVDFHAMPIVGKADPGPPHFGRKTISLNYTLIVPTPDGKSDKRVVGLTDLHETFQILKVGLDSEDTRPSKVRSAPVGSAFIQPGSWWNLFFSEGNDPLQRSIQVVKILKLDETRPSWIKIAFPKDREEHFSIFGPAAKAHDSDDLSIEAAIASWEESVAEWKVIWVNLDFVVHMTRLGEPDPAIPHEKEASSPEAGTLEGKWRAELPAGFKQSVRLKEVGKNRYSLSSSAEVFNGIYEWKEGKLEVVKPNDARMQGLVWSWDGKAFTLIAEPREVPTGSSYLGTRLSQGPPATKE